MIEIANEMTAEEAVAALSALDDGCFSHYDAEAILLAVLRENDLSDVANAFEDARRRCGFNYP